MGRASVGLALGAAITAIFVAISGAPARATEPESCSIHVWQRGIYKSASASNFGAFGLVGALLQDDYNRKYPAASVEGVMEDVLHIDALPRTIASIPWRDFTGAENNDIVFEHEAITDSRLKELKASTARNSKALDACYIELYIGKQIFSGGGMKSHLFSDFDARTFYGGVQNDKSANMFAQTRHLSVKDAESLVSARQIISDGFVATLTKFLANKLPKRKVQG